MLPPQARKELTALLGPRGYLDRPEDLLLYEYDGSVDKARPEMVVFPRSTEDVVAIVKITREHNVTIVGRGAGTGLSGGAIPRAGGVTIGFSRMNRILEIDLANERAVVQPGVVNLDITLAVQGQKYFYAPDPSSQRACTIGGNVSENAGGPHTLAYGVTTNHVLGLEMVLPDGSVYCTGGKEPELPGYDLTGLMTGSEGTMALVTKVVVRLMRQPELVKTILAIYDSADDCGRTVAEITARAITPVAVEMLDGVMLRTQIAPTLRLIGEVGEKYGLTISNIFHAGDGNMHPIILFDSRKPGDLDKARHAGEDILTYCISVGGSITGEHGVGMEKNELMDRLFPADSL